MGYPYRKFDKTLIVPNKLREALDGNIPEELWRADIVGDYENSLDIYFLRFIPIKFTPKGCWAVDEYSTASEYDEYNKRFILLVPGKKRYAYASKEEALWNLILRKEHALKYAQKNLYKQRMFYYYLKNKEPKEILEKLEREALHREGVLLQNR